MQGTCTLITYFKLPKMDWIGISYLVNLMIFTRKQSMRIDVEEELAVENT